MILAFILLAQVQSADLEQDREGFEPYRQCVLSKARSQYPSGATLKTIFDSAKKACANEEALSTADLALNAAGRAIEEAAAGEVDARPPEMRFDQFERELLFELANDFVPKVK
jgi:hypothetical protein